MGSAFWVVGRLSGSLEPGKQNYFHVHSRRNTSYLDSKWQQGIYTAGDHCWGPEQEGRELAELSPEQGIDKST